MRDSRSGDSTGFPIGLADGAYGERFECPRGDDHRFAALDSGQAKPSLQIESVSDLLELALADEKAGEKAHARMRDYPTSLKIFM